MPVTGQESLQDKSIYLHYHHGEITYFMGPFEGPADAERAYTHFEKIRAQLVKLDASRFSDLELNLIRIVGERR